MDSTREQELTTQRFKHKHEESNQMNAYLACDTLYALLHTRRENKWKQGAEFVACYDMIKTKTMHGKNF